MLVARVVQRVPWLHLGIGIFGNATFLVGSVLFLWAGTQIYGVWLFIIGASGMLVNSVGEMILRHTRHEAARHPG